MCKQNIYWWTLCYMGDHDWFKETSRSSKFVLFSNNKKLRAAAIQNILLKIKLKNIKKTWVNDDKRVYIREDLAYNLIRYRNLGVLKADKFTKSLGILNNQLIQREREIISTRMKIFSAESTARQYEIDGLSFEVYLYFLVHKLVVEIDEDDHVSYDEKKHQIP